MKLSVCMIVKNEAEYIEDCLRSVQAIADEIILVDTGCTDETLLLAKPFNVKIIESAWQDDFSKARNVSISRAQGEWILWIDADERLDPQSIPVLKSLLKKPQKPTAYTVQIHNLMPDGKNYKISGAHRLFSNHFGISFSGRIHEQITRSLAGLSGEVHECAVTLKHLGYGLDAKKQAKKNRRNRELLLKMVKEDPRNGYAYFTLAQNFSQTEEWTTARTYYEKALQYEKFDQGMRASLYNTYAETLFHLNQTRKARTYTQKSIALVSRQVGAHYLLFKLAEKEGNLEQVISALQTLLEVNRQVRAKGKSVSTDILLPDDDIIAEIITRYEKSGMPEQALNWFPKLSAEREKSQSEILRRARLELQAGHWQKTVELIENNGLADHKVAWPLLAFCALKSEDWTKARLFYEKLVTNDPQNVEFIKRLAAVYGKLGLLEQAGALVVHLQKLQTPA